MMSGNDVRQKFPRLVDGLLSTGRLAHDLELIVSLQAGPDALANKRVIVHQQYFDFHICLSVPAATTRRIATGPAAQKLRSVTGFRFMVAYLPSPGLIHNGY
jgi:hypothetical protein